MNETDELMTEVQELVWAMIDDQATDREVHRLEELLLENDEARKTYVMCMQMHADLHFLLGKAPTKLPAALEKAQKVANPKKATAPLPLVNLPPVGSTLSISDAFPS
jgi:hypothetical protein